jgi:hypothetical protein
MRARVFLRSKVPYLGVDKLMHRAGLLKLEVLRVHFCLKKLANAPLPIRSDQLCVNKEKSNVFL